MGLRQWAYSSSVVLASLGSGTCVVAAEDDVIIDGEKPPETPVQLRLQLQPQFVFLGRPVAGEGKIQLVRRQVVPRLGRAVIVQDIQFDDELFDRMIFGIGPQTVKDRLNKELLASINKIDLICVLTPAQKRKLELIGRGDQKRLFDEVEALRGKFRDGGLADASPNGPHVRTLRAKVSGNILGKGSFFQKSLRTVLTAEQFEKYSPAPRGELKFSGPS